MRSRGAPRTRFVGVGFLALLTVLSCSDSERAESPRSLVLCVVDTLREDGLAEMPSLRALGESGTRIEKAYATSSWTRPSLASIFTGRFPAEHGVHEPRQPLPESAWTLAEALSEQGFHTRAIVSNPILREKWGYAQGFDSYDDELCLGPDAMTSERLAEKALAELEELQQGDEPFFLFVLFFDPHWEYRGRSEAESVGRLDGSQRTQELSGMELLPEELQYVRSLYGEEVRAVDRALERLVSAVKEDVLIAITADHGECLGEREGFFGHVENLREEVVRVPLILNVALQQELSKGQEFSLASLPGMLCTELGLQGDLGFATGREALFEVDYLPTRFRSAQRTKRSGIRDGNWKLVVDDLAGSVALYDMEQDGEECDLAQEQTAIVRELMKKLRAAQTGQVRATEEVLSREDLETLSELGYADEE